VSRSESHFRTTTAPSFRHKSQQRPYSLLRNIIQHLSEMEHFQKFFHNHQESKSAKRSTMPTSATPRPATQANPNVDETSITSETSTNILTPDAGTMETVWNSFHGLTKWAFINPKDYPYPGYAKEIEEVRSKQTLWCHLDSSPRKVLTQARTLDRAVPCVCREELPYIVQGRV